MKTSAIKLSALLISGAMLCSVLSACSSSPDATSQETSSTSQTSSITLDATSYQMQIAYYESLIKELEATLLYIKEENYVESATYKQTIAELEEKITHLNTKVDILTQEGKQPSDNQFKEQVSTKPNLSTVEQVSQTNGMILNNGSVILGYNGNEKDISIPKQINGINIKKIGESAFKDSPLQKIAISDGIEYIDWFAFSGCKQLTEIYIPSSVTSIGYGAFDNCSSFLIIKCPKDSYAEAYAKSWGILVVNE